MIDYEYMALMLSNLSGIPVRLYREGIFQGLYHTSKFYPDLAILEEPNIFKNPASVSYYMTKEFLFYGLFRVKNEPVSMVLGPISQMPVDKARAGRILLSVGEPAARATELQNYLRSIPGYPLRNFLQILCTFAYFLNEEKLSIGDILLPEEDMSMPKLSPSKSEPQDAPSSTGHNTYDLEQTMLSLIEHGRVEELAQLFRQPAAGRVGVVAHDALRQQKNLLIVTATLASRAAIRGGLDVETSFALSDLYIQKAELLSSYEKLAALSMQMVMDYAGQVAALRCGAGNRRFVREIRRYVLAHINERITTAQLADYLGQNRTYLCTHFKEETGFSLSSYIADIKMDEAKRLLTVSDKPLRSIAEQLGYTDQSYFQNVFKKKTGMTPLEYREEEKRMV